MAAIAYITSLASDLDLDIAFADGCDVRFRADAFGSDNGAQCPACGRDGGMHWIGVHVPGVWDRFGCDYCGRHYSVESHVAELMPRCASGCQRPGLIASPIPNPEIDEDAGYCPPSYLFDLGEVWTCGSEHCRDESAKVAREASGGGGRQQRSAEAGARAPRGALCGGRGPASLQAQDRPDRQRGEQQTEAEAACGGAG